MCYALINAERIVLLLQCHTPDHPGNVNLGTGPETLVLTDKVTLAYIGES